MRLFLSSILLFNLGMTCLAQLPYHLGGARAAAMGNASVAVFDAWAFQYNIGALAGVEETSLQSGYQTRLNMHELSTGGISLVLPLRFGVAGAGFTRYGFGPYHLTEGSLGFAHQINLVSVGLQAGFVQEAARGFGSRMVPVLSIGGTAQLLPKIRFGAFAYNLTQSRLNPETGEYLPSLLRAGLLWQPREVLLITVETEKDVDYQAHFKSGLEYKIHALVSLRGGISTAPVSLHGGFGLSPGKFRFDYALQHHHYLGIMHHLSAGWIIGEKK